MKRIFIKTLVLAFFLAAPAYSDLYKWTDREGVVHITDDKDKVPAEFMGEVKVYKTAPVEKPAPKPGMEPPAEELAELYGEKTLEWWKETFNKLNGEIASLEAGIAAKRQFNDVYEAGRRFGQVFGSDERKTYERNKTELKSEEARLEGLRGEREELRRKAAYHGVPKGIRGE